jgi:hypothetical protein
MAEPIANDWKAINSRMRQIRAERVEPRPPPCQQCKNTGWVSDQPSHREIHQWVCSACGNPEHRPSPFR